MTMLHVRSNAVTCAVTCFFGIGIVGAVNGLSPMACCKRALLGAVATYLVTGIVIRAINAILIQAIVDYQIKKERMGEDET
jgi:predicted cation transporter